MIKYSVSGSPSASAPAYPSASASASASTSATPDSSSSKSLALVTLIVPASMRTQYFVNSCTTEYLIITVPSKSGGGTHEASTSSLGWLLVCVMELLMPPPQLTYATSSDP